ncbi:UDP-N-acetylglucosamine diphosphorylase [Coprinopsis sp. MPI-PUGE-AT-0042]|nr:UDP-N-acetylglucosamine diphosphorylase [Coprinopsis sp. MPI-PUGE-AT-0042]
MSIDELRKRYQAAGQDHLFKFWDTLSPEQRTQLESQLSALDIERVNRIYTKAVSTEAAANDPNAEAESIDPLPKDASESVSNAEKVKEWRQIGLEAIARNEVGVLLMAGGQGTRLGSSAPKGCYDIGLPSHKSLFQYQAERLARLQEVAAQETGKSVGSVRIPWYIMTSGPTRPKQSNSSRRTITLASVPRTSSFLSKVRTLPCLTMEGKVILETPSRVAVAPDGNGGVYAATRSPLSPEEPNRTVLSDLGSQNILYVHAYCVDNCLVRIADPVFLGYSISKQAECAAKVVPKTQPTESVGVVACRGNKFSVSRLSGWTAETGELAFRAGNIANHFYTTAFLNRVSDFEDELAFHIARKKIPHTDLESGESLFVFDVFPFTERFTVLEVDRKEEFSPLKNAPGTGADDPDTSRRDLLAQHKRFLEAAGASVASGVEIEISPRLSYAGEGLESVKGKTFTKSALVENIEELDVLA